jgi:hypothetical protein
MTINDDSPKLARVYNSSASAWIPLTGVPAPHTHNLSDLGLVIITNPQNGQVLKYNASASAWTNQNP